MSHERQVGRWWLLGLLCVCAWGCQKRAKLPVFDLDRRSNTPSRWSKVAPSPSWIKWGKPEKLTQLHVRFFAAGHGDSILLRTPQGHALLIDLGRGSVPELGDHLVARRLLPFLIERGVRWLDGLFITHPHYDHFGDPVALGRIIRFDKIYANADAAYLLPGWYPIPSAIFRPLTQGWSKRFGQLLLEVLNPAKDGKPPEQVYGIARHNNRSLVLRATYGKIKFLLTGDLMLRGEYRMLRKRLPGRAQVLKLGHHGFGSTSAAWLRAVRPRYAVATIGDKKNRRYDYPSRKLFQRLRRFQVRLLRTDRHGDVLFRTDGKKLTVQTFPKLIHIPAWKRKLDRRRQMMRRSIP